MGNGLAIGGSSVWTQNGDDMEASGYRVVLNADDDAGVDAMGLVARRNGAADACLLWDETNDRFILGTTTADTIATTTQGTLLVATLFATTSLHLHTNLNAGLSYNSGRLNMWGNEAGPVSTQAVLDSGSFIIKTAGLYAWGDPSAITRDTGLARNAAGTVEVNNGTGGTFRDLIARSILAKGATQGIGYGSGAGGTQTQATSKSTGVTLNTVCGTITMHDATLNAAAEVSFTLTNSAIAATDVVIVNHSAAGTAGAYLVGISTIASGSCVITVANLSGSNLGEAIVLSFAVIKAVTS